MTNDATPAAVRRWATEQSYAVGAGGRLSPDLVAAYGAAQASAAPPAATAVSAHDAACEPSQSGARVAVRPLPGADGPGRRIIARSS